MANNNNTKAYILVKTEPNKTKDAYRKLGDLAGVKSFNSVTGAFDAVLTVEENSIQKIGDFVLGKVRQIQGVTDTQTLISTE